MPDTELLRDDEISTGVGANIIVRKKKPGPTVGKGYIIEIYENGVKVDEKEVEGKKDVKEIINAYKDKYNTQRSFQDEVLTHITYKTKEERGEELTLPAEQERILREERENNQQERGEVAMQSIDKILTKKAGEIHSLLQRLINPGTPIKKRATDVEEGDVSFLPETPNAPGMESAELTEDGIATEITKKIVEYFNEKVTESPTEGTDKETKSAPVAGNASPVVPTAPTASKSIPGNVPPPIAASSNKERIKVSYEKDDLYNDIKGWLTKVKKILKNHEKSVGKGLDRTKVIELVKNIVTSGNPAEIEKATGIAVGKEAAEVMQDIMLKETGSPEPGQNTQQLGKETKTMGGTLADTIGKAAATLEDKAVKVVGLANGGKEEDAVDFLKETGLNEVDEIDKLLPNTMNVNKIKNIIDEIIQETMGKDSGEDISIVEVCASEFWNYAGRLNRVASVDRIFEEWINKKGMSLDSALGVWNKIQSDVNIAFNKTKKAVYRHKKDPVFKLSVTHIKDNGAGTILYSTIGFIENGKIVIEDSSGLDSLIQGNISFDVELRRFLRDEISIPLKLNNDTAKDVKSKELSNILTKMYNFILTPKNFLMSEIKHLINTQGGEINIVFYGPSGEITSEIFNKTSLDIQKEKIKTAPEIVFEKERIEKERKEKEKKELEEKKKQQDTDYRDRLTNLLNKKKLERQNNIDTDETA